MLPAFSVHCYISSRSVFSPMHSPRFPLSSFFLLSCFHLHSEVFVIVFICSLYRLFPLTYTMLIFDDLALMTIHITLRLIKLTNIVY